MQRANFLRKKADFIRNKVISICLENNAGHIASALSCVDIMVALYYQAMRYRPLNPLWEGRDRLVFSKGHGSYALYAVLADLGIIPEGKLKKSGGSSMFLPGCIERNPKYGIEAGCGSLGHGLPIAVGMALGAKLQKKKYRIYCVTGDGEMQEGSNWEALQFALKHELKNLTIICDFNRLQALDFITEVMDRREGDVIKRLKGFGLMPVSCPGHDAAKLAGEIIKLKKTADKRPRVIVARTIKGYGLKCMENVPKFHYRIPDAAEMAMGKTYGEKE